MRNDVLSKVTHVYTFWDLVQIAKLCAPILLMIDPHMIAISILSPATWAKCHLLHHLAWTIFSLEDFNSGD